MVKEGEDPWPCIICDEEMVEMHFKKHGKRPDGARRPDGSWPDQVLWAGKFPGAKVYPAMCLGSMTFHWIPWKRLEPLDTQMASRKMKETSNVILKEAFEEVISQRDLAYWKSELLARTFQDGNESYTPSKKRRSEENKGSKSSKRKSAYTGPTEFKYPMGWNTNDNQDDDETPIFLRDIKQEHTTDGSFKEDSSGLYDTLDAEDPERGVSRPNRRSAGLSHSRSLATPSITSSKSHNDKTCIALDHVRIYVGNPHDTFVVKQSGVEQSTVPSSLQKFQSGEWFIMCPLLMGMSPSDFKPVVEYLDRGEYRPNLLDEHTDYVRLENINTEEDRSHIIIQCGVLYGLAGQVDLPNLQDLVIRKLKAIGSYPAPELLSITNLLYRDGRPAEFAVHNFLVDYLAENYYAIWESDSMKFMETLKDNSDLARSVHAKLGDSAKVDLEEIDEFVKGRVNKEENMEDEPLIVD